MRKREREREGGEGRGEGARKNASMANKCESKQKVWEINFHFANQIYCTLCEAYSITCHATHTHTQTHTQTYRGREKSGKEWPREREGVRFSRPVSRHYASLSHSSCANATTAAFALSLAHLLSSTVCEREKSCVREWVRRSCCSPAVPARPAHLQRSIACLLRSFRSAIAPSHFDSHAQHSSNSNNSNSSSGDGGSNRLCPPEFNTGLAVSLLLFA